MYNWYLQLMYLPQLCTYNTKVYTGDTYSLQYKTNTIITSILVKEKTKVLIKQ